MSKTKDRNAPLRRDVKMLGNILGEILLLHGGQTLFNEVESIRQMTKSNRENFNQETYEQLKEKISMLKPPLRQQVIRSFSIYFHLVNIAEQNHRIRRKREYILSDEELQSFSVEEAVERVKHQELRAEEIHDLLKELSIELVITAHPTEAIKRTVLEIQKRISQNLRKLDQKDITPREKSRIKESLFNEVTALWHTNELRKIKLDVMDEVKNGLYYFNDTLFDTLPTIFQELEAQLEEKIGNYSWKVPNFIYFGSWIGGDRDGNPYVTPEITWKTLDMQRELVLRKYVEAITDLMKRFSQSTDRIKIKEQFIEETIKQEEAYLSPSERWPVKSEIYRRRFAVILKRVQETGKSKSGYEKPEQLREDLLDIQENAESFLPAYKRLKTIRKVLRQVELFGFHLATLDIRNHSGEHEFATEELLKLVNIEHAYSSLSEDEKQKLLLRLIKEARPVLLQNHNYSQRTENVLNIFRMIYDVQKQFGERAVQVYIVSMTKSPSDLLEVLLLAKETGLFTLLPNGEVKSKLDFVPLLETIDDLSRGAETMEKLFASEIYRRHLAARNNEQEIMLGYSDGSKDGSTLTANWNLFKTQSKIHNMAKSYKLRLKFFHGRGGSLGRGGGSLNTSILSQPAETLGDGVKITEQGEVLSSRYLLEDIAYRNLEQAASALLVACAEIKASPELIENRKASWEEAMDFLAEASLDKYESLVFEDRDFLSYFKEATPLNELGELNIGSRPMSRRNSERFEDLRAIPWVFAWTQSRQMIPAWYAAGTALKSFIDAQDGHLALLQDMYENWRFFQSTINNLQMALVKSDMATGKEYVELVKDRDLGERIFNHISSEYHLTKEMLLKITKKEKLLSHIPNIRDSVQLRNPYVDPLNLLQVELIKELRETDNPSEELITEVLLTINGIAAGLMNTG